jgi:hypothetical protein
VKNRRRRQLEKGVAARRHGSAGGRGCKKLVVPADGGSEVSLRDEYVRSRVNFMKKNDMATVSVMGLGPLNSRPRRRMVGANQVDVEEHPYTSCWAVVTVGRMRRESRLMDHGVGRIIFLFCFDLLPKATPAHGRQAAIRRQRKIQQQAKSPKEEKNSCDRIAGTDSVAFPST